MSNIGNNSSDNSRAYFNDLTRNQDLSNNLELNLTNSYMNFVSTTNTSLNHMLSIINEQQYSYDQLLRQHTLTAHPRQIYQPNIVTIPPVSLFPSRQTIPSTVLPSLNRNRNMLRRSRIERPRARHVVNRYNLRDYFSDILPNHSIPSAHQIESAIDRKQFQDIENPLNHSCPISHNDFSANDQVIQLRGCNHIFSPGSILRWFERHAECPLCRRDIRNNGENGENEENDEENEENEENDEESNIDQINSPTSTPLPIAQQLANIISDQITSIRDFSGNISIELDIAPGLI